MTTDKGAAFRALHQKGNPFILANAWDAGSAKMLAALGAEAIGTSSSAHAFTLGRPDMGQVGRSEALDHARLLVEATDLPVSGDFENGFEASPEGVAETVRLSFEAGLAGISIEDTDLPGTGAYPRDLATARIEAAVEAARALPGDFVLVARADGVLNRTYDMAEARARMEAFDATGADCLYVPYPPAFDDIAALCAETDTPVNALAVGKYAKLSRADFAAAGVARISLGSALARVAQQSLINAAQPMLETGDFSGLLSGARGDIVDRMLTDT